MGTFWSIPILVFIIIIMNQGLSHRKIGKCKICCWFMAKIFSFIITINTFFKNSVVFGISQEGLLIFNPQISEDPFPLFLIVKSGSGHWRKSWISGGLHVGLPQRKVKNSSILLMVHLYPSIWTICIMGAIKIKLITGF